MNTANLFTDEELAIQQTAHSYCQERMLPRILGTTASPEILVAMADELFTRSVSKRRI